MKMKYILGIDTSNYKCSVAIVDAEKLNVISHYEKLLPVKLGQRGLRQSEAFFHQTNMFPSMLEKIMQDLGKEQIVAICASSKPRSREGSYMPVFLSGMNFGKALGVALGCPLFYCSHQEGHLLAVKNIWDLEDDFLFFHMSGGTSEIIHAKRKEQKRYLSDDNYISCFDMEIFGGTKDISIGQLIDRIGVAAGLPFPAGSYMDELALKSSCDFKSIRAENPFYSVIKSQSGYFNLSGNETRVLRLLENGDENNLNKVSNGLFMTCADLIYNTLRDIASGLSVKEILLAGGVSSSLFIRSALDRITYIKPIRNIDNVEVRLQFGNPILSSDNGVGVARLGGVGFWQLNQ